jgi:hypothetical protein
LEEIIQSNIINILKVEERSISGIKKELDKKGIRMHRLTLAGYLTAMVDNQKLKVKEIKPSKVYSINERETASIYKKVGEMVKENFSEFQGEACLGCLYYLFNRPIFIREIELCNVDLPKMYRKSISTKKEIFIKSFHEVGVEIPENEMLIEPENLNTTQVMRLLRSVIISQSNLLVQNYLVENEQKTLEDL